LTAERPARSGRVRPSSGLVVVDAGAPRPRRCGLPLSAAVFCLATLSFRGPCGPSCWIVGHRPAFLLRLGVFVRTAGMHLRPLCTWSSSVSRGLGRVTRPAPRTLRGTASVPTGFGKDFRRLPPARGSTEVPQPERRRQARRSGPDVGRARLPKITSRPVVQVKTGWVSHLTRDPSHGGAVSCNGVARCAIPGRRGDAAYSVSP